MKEKLEEIIDWFHTPTLNNTINFTKTFSIKREWLRLKLQCLVATSSLSFYHKYLALMWKFSRKQQRFRRNNNISLAKNSTFSVLSKNKFLFLFWLHYKMRIRHRQIRHELNWTVCCPAVFLLKHASSFTLRSCFQDMTPCKLIKVQVGSKNET